MHERNILRNKKLHLVKSADGRTVSIEENAQLFAERKEMLLKAFREIVAKELAKNPKFNLSKKIIEGMLDESPDVFLGIKTYYGLIMYFARDLNFLRKELSLPEIRT